MTQPVNPPDGWLPTAGVWGVDFQRSTSVYLTSGSSLAVIGTAGNTQTLQGPWFPLDGNGVGYDVTGVVQATNNTSLFTLKMECYAGDKTTLLNTIYLYNNQAVPTANAWQTASAEFNTASNYSWGRFILTRASGATSTIYMDRVEVKKLGPRWACFKSNAGGNQVISSPQTTYSAITCDTVDYSSLVTVSGTGVVTIYRAGLYLLYLRANVSFPAGTAFNVRFEANDPVLGPITLGTGQYETLLITHTSLYRHTGTTGAGTTIFPSILLPSGGTVFGNPSGTFNGNTYATGWTGVWLGLG